MVGGGASETAAPNDADDAFVLAVETPVRLIREPYFGRLATVTAPRANVGVVAGG